MHTNFNRSRLAVAVIMALGTIGSAHAQVTDTRFDCDGAACPTLIDGAPAYSAYGDSMSPRHAVWVRGAEAQITFDRALITTEGEKQNGVLVTGGANATFDGASASIKGNQVRAYTVDGASLQINKGIHQVEGDDAIAILAFTGAQVQVTDKTTFLVNGGDNVIGVQAASAGTFVRLESDARDLNLSTTGPNSVGVKAQDKAIVWLRNTQINAGGVDSALQSQVIDVRSGASVVDLGSVMSASGAEAAGVVVFDGGKFEGVNSHIAANGTTNAMGVLASGNGSAVKLQDSNITTNGVGVQLTGGSQADITGTTFRATRGGVAVSDAQATLTNVDIYSDIAAAVSVSGSDAVVTLSDSRLRTHYAPASGIALTDASILLDKVDSTAAGNSISLSLTKAGDRSIDITNESYLIHNDGVLLNVKRSGPEADGNVALNVSGKSWIAGNVLDRDADGKTKVNVNSGSTWMGMLVEKSTVLVEAGASHEGSSARNESGVFATGGSVVAYADGADIGKDVTIHNKSSGKFGGQTKIDGTINATSGSSVVFAGPTTIGQNAHAVGSSYRFGGATTIAGNLRLEAGSSTAGGTIQTPIEVAGNVTVNGSQLGGNVRSNGVLTGSNARFTPGNSIGVQTFGSVGAVSGTFVAEVNAAGESDKIVVQNGNMDVSNIALVVSQENGTGGYRLDHDYTIIETPNGEVTGGKFLSQNLDETFAGTLVSLNDAKLGAGKATISLSSDEQKIEQATPLLSRNQQATLQGVLSVAGKNASADAALLSTDYANALDQLSGDLHASVSSSLIHSSQSTFDSIGTRMGNAHGPVWAQLQGGWTQMSGGSAAKAKTDRTTLLIGGDAPVGKGWRAGAVAGFEQADIKANDRNAKADVQTYSITAYAGKKWEGKTGTLGVTAGAGYAWHDVDAKRNVTVGGNQNLKAKYDANTASVFAQVDYEIPVNDRMSIKPYANVAHFSHKSDGFAEQGGDAALSSSKQTSKVTSFTLGAQGKADFSVGANDLQAFAGLGWRHSSGDLDGERKFAFVQGAGSQFTVQGAPVARNAAVVQAGLRAQVAKNTTVGLAYDGQFGSGLQDHAATLNLKVRF